MLNAVFIEYWGFNSYPANVENVVSS